MVVKKLNHLGYVYTKTFYFSPRIMNIRIITFARVGRINYSLIGGIYCVYHYIFVAMVMCAPRDRLHATVATIAYAYDRSNF